jgi:hypothetical protein
VFLFISHYIFRPNWSSSVASECSLKQLLFCYSVSLCNLRKILSLIYTSSLSQRETVSHEAFAVVRAVGRVIRKRQMPVLFSLEGHLFWLSEYGRLGCCQEP